MQAFLHLLLEVWREVARHLEIAESATTIAAMLSRHLPLGCLVVRRFDANTQSLETVVSAGSLRMPVRQGPYAAGRSKGATTGSMGQRRSHGSCAGGKAEW